MTVTKLFAMAAMAAIAVISPARAAAQAADSTAQPYALECAMGTVLGNALTNSIGQIQALGVDVNRQEVIRNVLEVLEGKDTGMTFQEADAYVGAYVARIQQERNKPLSEESQQAFLKSSAEGSGAITTPSGLVFRVITEGEGAMPGDDDSVSLLYSGSLSDGTVFDSTDTPVEFTVRNLVPGFTEGLKMMKPGGTYEITFPASLGYGERGIPGAIPGNAALRFKVELLGVIPPVQQ